MILIAAVAVIAVGAGYAIGGRIRGLERLRLRWWGLAPLGFAMQLAPIPAEGEGGDAAAIGLLIASYVVLLFFCGVNLRSPGFPVILLGLALNMAVITANGGMPVRAEALADSGQGELLVELREEGGAKHHLERDDDVLVVLADIIPIPRPVHQVVSVGDVVVYAGVVWLVAATMRRGRTRGRGERTA